MRHSIRSLRNLALVPYALAVGACAHGTAVPAGPSATAPATARATAAPRTYLMRADQLQLAKQRLAAGDGSLQPALAQLLRDAAAAMALQSITVTSKQLVPPSGDKHDFLSFGPYWWPDSTKSGGMPYVRRDGVVNPQSRVDHDGWRMHAMKDAVEALALAYWFTDDERYAARAAEHLRTFFLDPATRMNPHLQYAQSIPGVSAGRGIGILDSRHLVPLGDAIKLLVPSRAWTDADEQAMQEWMRTYLRWLRTSDNGRDEADEENNHGTYYDMQVVGIGLYLGDTAFVRSTLQGTRRRIDHHFERDGSQPLELARTRPLHYSVFNLDAYTQLAEMGRTVGDDLWHYVSPRGASLGAALRFVAPYADSSRPRPWQDVSPVVPNAFMMPMRRAALALGDPAFAAALAHTAEGVRTTDRSRLHFVTVP